MYLHTLCKWYDVPRAFVYTPKTNMDARSWRQYAQWNFEIEWAQLIGCNCKEGELHRKFRCCVHHLWRWSMTWRSWRQIKILFSTPCALEVEVVGVCENWRARPSHLCYIFWETAKWDWCLLRNGKIQKRRKCNFRWKWMFRATIQKCYMLRLQRSYNLQCAKPRLGQPTKQLARSDTFIYLWDFSQIFYCVISFVNMFIWTLKKIKVTALSLKTGLSSEILRY